MWRVKAVWHDGEKMYRVYRNNYISAVAHASRTEYEGDYFEDFQEAQAFADELNEGFEDDDD